MKVLDIIAAIMSICALVAVLGGLFVWGLPWLVVSGLALSWLSWGMIELGIDG